MGAGQQQSLLIKNVPRSLDISAVARILRQLDGTLPEDIADNISLKAPLMQATGGVSDYTVAQITELPVSDDLLRKLRREDGAAPLPGTEHWYVRPSPEENQQDHVRIIPSQNEINMLRALKAAGWTKVEIEQLFRKAANQALSGSPAFGAVLEVVMKDVKMLPAMGDKSGRRTPYEINFEEAGGAKIIFRDRETMLAGADRLIRINCSLSTLAGLPDMRMTLELSTERPGGAYADGRQEENRRKAVLRAQQLVTSGTRLFTWTARLKFDWKREDYGRYQNMNPKAAEPILMEALGGRPRGLVAVALGYEPGKNTVLWNEEITLVIREETLASWMAKTLSQGGGLSPVAGPWKSIVKHSNQRTAPELKEVPAARQDIADGGAAATRVAPSLAQVKTHISNVICARPEGFGTYPSRDIRGQQVNIIVTASTPCTPLDMLPPLGGEMDEEAESDLRSMVQERNWNVNSEVICRAVQDLVGEGVLQFEAPTDTGPYKFWSRVTAADMFSADGF